jgi:hypothetical protein
MQDKANPLATILSAAMLLKYGLGVESAAKRIEAAVTKTLDCGFRTGDIYSRGTVRLVCAMNFISLLNNCYIYVEETVECVLAVLYVSVKQKLKSSSTLICSSVLEYQVLRLIDRRL